MRMTLSSPSPLPPSSVDERRSRPGIEDGSLVRALAGLLVEPPDDLVTRVVSSWVKLPAPLLGGSGPVGDLYVALSDRGVSFVRPSRALGGDPGRFCAEFRERFSRPIRPEPGPPPGRLGAAMTGLLEALGAGAGAGGGLTFDLGTLGDFDRAVLAKTAEIPPGQTRSYAWVAREIGRPRAVRAAGSALGRNPVPIFIPCHRVVRSDGDPGNYGLGPRLKRALLAGEGVALDGRGRLAAPGREP